MGARWPFAQAIISCPSSGMRPVEISLRANTAFGLIAQRRQDEIEVPDILINEKKLSGSASLPNGRSSPR